MVSREQFPKTEKTWKVLIGKNEKKGDETDKPCVSMKDKTKDSAPQQVPRSLDRVNRYEKTPKNTQSVLCFHTANNGNLLSQGRFESLPDLFFALNNLVKEHLNKCK